jgi:hypothetical protein
MFIKEHNVETGEVIEREMTVEEIEEFELNKAEAFAKAKAQATKAKAKAALLEKLGLTADELKVLLG